MNKVTDPALLQKLNSGPAANVPGKVTDPAILQRLDAPKMTPQQRDLIHDVRPMGSGAYDVGSGVGVADVFDEGTGMVGLEGPEIRKNALPSTVNVMKSLVMPITNPGEFVEGVGDMAMAGVENFASNIPGFEEIPTPMRDVIVDGYKDRYGSVEALKNTVETDPAGAAFDAISFGIAGAVGLKGTKATVGAVAESAYTDDLPIRIYESAAKFSTTLSDVERKQITETLLREKIPLSSGGVRKAVDTIGALNEMIDKIIQASDKGIRYPREWAVRQLKHLAESKMGQLGGGYDANVIMKVVDNYLGDLESMDSKFMTLTELQDWKKNAYKRINWRVANEKQTAKNAAYKEAASTVRGDIESVTPGTTISDLNRREGSLIEAMDHLTRSANRGNNNNFLGMDSFLKPVGGGLGASAFGIDPAFGVGVGAIMSALGKPGMKSSIAQVMYDLRRAGKGSPENEKLIKAMLIPYLAQQREDMPP